MLAPELIQQLHRHRRWSRDRVIEAARQLGVSELPETNLITMAREARVQT